MKWSAGCWSPGEVVVIEMKCDELVERPQGLGGHLGQLVGRHGECLQLRWTGTGQWSAHRVTSVTTLCTQLTI